MTGKLVVDALVRGPARLCARLDAAARGRRALRRAARAAGDVVLTVGAGDVDRAARLILDGAAVR